jgi:DNA modification methylase
MNNAQILVGDARIRLAELADGSVQTCITSPPYFGLRDYGHGDQMGLEATPHEYVKGMVALFREVWRVLADDGTLWLNLGDSYAGSGKGGQSAEKRSEGWQPEYANKGATYGLKPKDLIGIPWRVAFALQADGWWLRQDIIWAKPNPMPESVTDRCTKSHEYLFLLSKGARYYCNMEAILEPVADTTTARLATNLDGQRGSDRAYGKGQNMKAVGRKAPRFGGEKYGDSDDPMHATKSGNEYEFTGWRNKRDVWTIGSKPFKGAHFAVMPEALAEPCVLAGSSEGDTVLDPFAGSGTVGVVALRHQRNFVGCELNPEYAQMAKNRIVDDAPMLNDCMVKTYLSHKIPSQ